MTANAERCSGPWAAWLATAGGGPTSRPRGHHRRLRSVRVHVRAAALPGRPVRDPLAGFRGEARQRGRPKGGGRGVAQRRSGDHHYGDGEPLARAIRQGLRQAVRTPLAVRREGVRPESERSVARCSTSRRRIGRRNAIESPLRPRGGRPVTRPIPIRKQVVLPGAGNTGSSSERVPRVDSSRRGRVPVDPFARHRLAIKQCLALADHRLTAAVKLLATVRRMPVEEVLGWVRAAEALGHPHRFLRIQLDAGRSRGTGNAGDRLALPTPPSQA